MVDGWLDDVFGRANKLSAMAARLDALDLQGLAKDGVLDTAVKATLKGNEVDVSKVATRRKRAIARAETLRKNRSDELRRRTKLQETLDDTSAIDRKAACLRAHVDRLRQARQERENKNATRRFVRDAKKRFEGPRRVFPETPITVDDPVLRRARFLCDNAARITADLLAPKAKPVVPVVVTTPEEDALVAKAKALLADYEAPYEPYRSDAIARQDKRLEEARLLAAAALEAAGLSPKGRPS